MYKAIHEQVEGKTMTVALWQQVDACRKAMLMLKYQEHAENVSRSSKPVSSRSAEKRRKNAIAVRKYAAKKRAAAYGASY